MCSLAQVWHSYQHFDETLSQNLSFPLTVPVSSRRRAVQALAKTFDRHIMAIGQQDDSQPQLN